MNENFKKYHIFFSGIVGVEIRQMHVPAEVESGSVPFVILDCDYDLAESESNQVRLHSRFELNLKNF